MPDVQISLNRAELAELTAKLQSLHAIRFDAVAKKNVTEMLNAARHGGTPVRTGELRNSSGVQGDEMGYTKEYAPHVEYGHRTANGGYIPGRRFLKTIADAQQSVYEADLLEALRKG